MPSIADMYYSEYASQLTESNTWFAGFLAFRDTLLLISLKISSQNPFCQHKTTLVKCKQNGTSPVAVDNKSMVILKLDRFGQSELENCIGHSNWGLLWINGYVKWLGGITMTNLISQLLDCSQCQSLNLAHIVCSLRKTSRFIRLNAPVNIIPCPPRLGTSGALAEDLQHFVSIIGESGH